MADDPGSVPTARPAPFDAVFGAALSHAQAGDLPRAVELFDAAIEIDPAHAAAHCNRGVALAQLKQPERALDDYDRAIALRPDFALAHVNRGNVLRQLGRPEAALESFDRAIAIQPQLAESHLNRGLALKELAQWDAALASFERALAIKPLLAEACSNSAIVLRELGRHDAALMSCERAVAVNPGLAEAWLNLGVSLADFNRMTEAVAAYERALSLQADLADAHFNLAVALLLQGDYRRGWHHYEWRWRTGDRTGPRGRRNHPPPLWLGAEPLAGKRIILHAEQGLGDTLQFCRYATAVARRGATVFLEVQPPLQSLLRELEGVAQVLAYGDEWPEVDYRCPLMSLPLAFGTNLEAMPQASCYLHADPSRVAIWRERLGPGRRPRVGLIWSGRQDHARDRLRSIPLEELLRWLPDEADYVSLQKEVRESDLASLGASSSVLNFAPCLDDFSDTAALCECMDLVISVDTSVAHLSAALGRTTWILLHYSPDWRWLLDRADSPWYASVRLYRQPRIGDWGAVLRRVAEGLRARRHSHLLQRNMPA